MAYSGSQKTRLGLAGITRGRYGSFAGKAELIETFKAANRRRQMMKTPGRGMG